MVAIGLVTTVLTAYLGDKPVVKALGLLSRRNSVTDIPVALEHQLVGLGVLYLVATLVGIIGFVVSIVATATNRARIAGIIGIALGLLAPVISYLVFSYTVGNAAKGLF